ncbi:MAG: helix-turn-helix domain-containing protein [Elusimicrobia bacterium]|nr:helix-turn-helix domain-containing protein [Elusimicrobiota bacterium]
MARKKKSKKRGVFQSPPEVMDIKALAAYLGMGRTKIYNLIRQRKIPASRIGRQYRFSKAVVDNWLKEQLITSEERQMNLFKHQR